MYLKDKIKSVQRGIAGEQYDGAILWKWKDKCLCGLDELDVKTTSKRTNTDVDVDFMPNWTNFEHVGRESFKWTLAKQSWVSMETALWSTAHKHVGKMGRHHGGSDINDCAVPDGSCRYMKWVYICQSVYCECVTVDQRCLDRETLIYDIRHRLLLNCWRCPSTVIMAGLESLLLILTDVGCELICIHDPYFFTLCWLTHTHQISFCICLLKRFEIQPQRAKTRLKLSGTVTWAQLLVLLKC